MPFSAHLKLFDRFPPPPEPTLFRPDELLDPCRFFLLPGSRFNSSVESFQSILTKNYGVPFFPPCPCKLLFSELPLFIGLLSLSSRYLSFVKGPRHFSPCKVKPLNYYEMPIFSADSWFSVIEGPRHHTFFFSLYRLFLRAIPPPKGVDSTTNIVFVVLIGQF